MPHHNTHNDTRIKIFHLKQFKWSQTLKQFKWSQTTVFKTIHNKIYSFHLFQLQNYLKTPTNEKPMNQIKEQKRLTIVRDFNFVRVISYSHCDGSLQHPKQKPFKFHYLQPQIAVPQTRNRISSPQYITSSNSNPKWSLRELTKTKLLFCPKICYLRQKQITGGPHFCCDDILRGYLRSFIFQGSNMDSGLLQGPFIKFILPIFLLLNIKFN